MASAFVGLNNNAVAQSATAPGETGQLQSRIIGGEITPIAQVPATVALLRKARVELDGDLFQAQFCGGTVIADRWVLTAAHCLIDLEGNVVAANTLSVLSGSADLNAPSNQPIDVVRIITHAGFQSVEEGQDIALLELQLDAQVTPVSLNEFPVVDNELAFIAGWGAVNAADAERGQSFPNQLLGTFVNTTPGSICGTRFPDYNGFTDDTNICAGAIGGGRDSCQGDSGGPLYKVDPLTNRAVAIAGITSWGISCGLAQNPGVYTNVSSYVGWVREQLAPFNVQLRVQNTNPALDGNPDSGRLPTPAPAPTTPVQQQPSNDGVNVVADSSSDDDGFFSGTFGLSTLLLLLLSLARQQYNKSSRSPH